MFDKVSPTNVHETSFQSMAQLVNTQQMPGNASWQPFYSFIDYPKAMTGGPISIFLGQIIKVYQINRK